MFDFIKKNPDIKIYHMDRVPIPCIECPHFVGLEKEEWVACKKNSRYILSAYDAKIKICDAFKEKLTQMEKPT